MTKHLPFYEIKGNYQEVGEFLGITFRKNIQEDVKKRKLEIKNYASYLPKSQECLDITKHHFPNLIKESEAISKAADVSLIDYFFINNREVYDPEEGHDMKDSTNLDHCTVIAGFDHGKLIIGHNEDWSQDAQDEIYVLKATIGNTTFIGLNYMVAIPGLAASMNNFGLVQCINDIYQTNKIGIPKNYVTRAVLEAKTLDEAENIIRGVPRASGFNHVLAQGDEIRNIEIAGESIGVQKTIGKPYVHTNHYLTDELLSLEKFHTKSSEERYKRACELVKDNLSVQEIKNILSDTQNKDYPICRPDETIASAIFVPPELKAEFCYGHPCSGLFVSYDL
jgi:hypothetical protein